MNKYEVYEKGLTDLVWRSFRLKMIVLVVSLIGILLVSSALRNGRRVVGEINKRSMEARLQWTKKVPATVSSIVDLTKEPKFADPSQAELIDEVELRLYRLFLQGFPSDDPKESAGMEALKARSNEIQRFMDERENAYNLEFGMAYVKNNVFVNALTVIDFWPLVLLCTFAGVIAITMRQRACEIMLSAMIQDSSKTEERAVQSASTGFLVGDLKSASLGGERVAVYMRPLILLPEPLITTCLLIAILYFSIGLPETEMPSLFELNSTVFGYHTFVILVGCFLAFVLLKTRAYYESKIRAATGTRVLSWAEFGIAKWKQPIRSAVSKRTVDQIGVYFLSAVVLGSLFLPWIGKWQLRGFQLLLPQKPISQKGSIIFYKMDPWIIREMRIQLAVAIAFVVLMLVCVLARYRHKWRVLVDVCYYSALGILALIVNLVVYLALLDYNSQRAILNAVFTMFLGPGGSLTSMDTPRGIPLVMQYPMYGFFVFMVSLAGLCLWAILRRPSRAPRSV
jgi:hypothetical protein